MPVSPVGQQPSPTPGAAAPTPQIVATPQAIYQAARAQLSVLRDQLNSAENKREELTGELRSEGQPAAAKVGIEKRITEMDARIAELDKQVANAQSEVAKAAAIPGAAVEPPRAPRQGPPEEAYALGALFMFIVFLPISLAYARRIWRRSAKATVVMPPETADRLQAIEHAVETVALEVERIGEGQRFVTQLLAEAPARSIGAGAAQPISVRAAEGVRQER